MTPRFSTSTFETTALPRARVLGLGLEIEQYMWTYTDAQIREKQASVPRMMEGFSAFSFHGTAVSRDLAAVNALPDARLLELYNASYGHAAFHGIGSIVFHANYLTGVTTEAAWVSDKAAFWKAFLEDKPTFMRVYVENLANDTPDMLARLHDAVNDARFGICLDTGHACCNSHIPIEEWITVLGERIKHVHLHNNDGLSDRHWPLGRGALDMDDVLERLLTRADAGMLVLECDAQESLCWLNEHGYIGTDA